jgi:hypothetical protein
MTPLTHNNRSASSWKLGQVWAEVGKRFHEPTMATTTDWYEVRSLTSY